MSEEKESGNSKPRMASQHGIIFQKRQAKRQVLLSTALCKAWGQELPPREKEGGQRRKDPALSEQVIMVRPSERIRALGFYEIKGRKEKHTMYWFGEQVLSQARACGP